MYCSQRPVLPCHRHKLLKILMHRKIPEASKANVAPFEWLSLFTYLIPSISIPNRPLLVTIKMLCSQIQ